MVTTSVREALNRLPVEGLVDRIDQRGFCAASLGWSELPMLPESRCGIEALAFAFVLRQSIEHQTPAGRTHQSCWPAGFRTRRDRWQTTATCRTRSGKTFTRSCTMSCWATVRRGGCAIFCVPGWRGLSLSSGVGFANHAGTMGPNTWRSTASALIARWMRPWRCCMRITGALPAHGCTDGGIDPGASLLSHCRMGPRWPESICRPFCATRLSSAGLPLQSSIFHFNSTEIFHAQPESKK